MIFQTTGFLGSKPSDNRMDVWYIPSISEIFLFALVSSITTNLCHGQKSDNCADLPIPTPPARLGLVRVDASDPQFARCQVSRTMCYSNGRWSSIRLFIGIFRWDPLKISQNVWIARWRFPFRHRATPQFSSRCLPQMGWRSSPSFVHLVVFGCHS